jgi:hypothetical protein
MNVYEIIKTWPLEDKQVEGRSGDLHRIIRNMCTARDKLARVSTRKKAEMVPADFANYFLASAGAGGALVGLLFVGPTGSLRWCVRGATQRLLHFIGGTDSRGQSGLGHARHEPGEPLQYDKSGMDAVAATTHMATALAPGIHDSGQSHALWI